MPRNQVQFQKGLSLKKFLDTYGTEEQCQKNLFKARWPAGYVCPECGHNRCYTLTSRRLYQCVNCRNQCSLTSGTIFAATKLPLTTWFLGIFLVTQSKEGMSALNLRRLLGITINAAMRMKHKLQHVMKSADDSMALEGLVELDDVYWGGKSKGGKRGRGAPGKTPFLAAVARNEKGHPIHMRMSKVQSFTSSEVERWSLKHLHRQSIVITDGFMPFRGLSNVVPFHGAINTSGIYDNPDNKIFHWVNTMIGNVKRAIHGTYHSVSSRHLPRYLAEYCFRFNNRFCMGAMVSSLIGHAAATHPIPQHQLKLAEE
jgi:transposase-like protein